MLSTANSLPNPCVAICDLIRRNPHPSSQILPLAVLGLPLLLAAVGCGDEVERPEVHPVQGMLFVNGEAAEGARVTLHPADGNNFDERGSRPSGIVDADGRFIVRTYKVGDGAPTGTYATSIIWLANPDSLGPTPDQLGGQYADPKTSQFQVTVIEGDNQLEPFEIDKIRLRTGRSDQAPAGPDGLE